MASTLLLRTPTSADRDAIRDLAVGNAMFEPEEFEEVLGLLDAALAGDLPDQRWLVAVGDDHQVVGAAYCAPEPFGDRVWNLYFLATSPHHHGTGVGTALIGRIEGDLRQVGEGAARVLIVETSSTEQYTDARAFYLARGFDREASIREYYGPGDDKVVFWRSLV